MKRNLLLNIFLVFAACNYAQTADILKIRYYRQKQAHQWVTEFASFLSIPNVASAMPDMQRNANFIMQMMKQRGIQRVQLLYPETKNIPPAVFGEVTVPGASRTIIFYAHYDGQPVDTTKWSKGLHPFKPALLNGSLEKKASVISFPNANEKYDPEWRIYARGASDDKAGVMAVLAAYEAMVQSGLSPSYNIKFFFEGEEEAGSEHLHQILREQSSQLKSDLWIICDGPVHQSGKKLVSFGVRGDAHVELTVYGSNRPLHSGHYGNWAPNPAMMLARLLASMKDDNGKVAIKGFYDNVIPLTASEKKALNEIPAADIQMKNELGFVNEEIKGVSLAQAIMLPSLNINGMKSANVGKLASNVIPTTATASLDLRLVLGNDYRRQQEKVVNHIRQQGYYVIEHDPTNEERKTYPRIAKIRLSDGYNAQRTSMDIPLAKLVINAVKSTTNDRVVLVPSAGGSLPLFVFEKYLHAKTITVPIANHDNNQHAENENIRLQNLWNGIETMAALMMMK